MHYRFDENLSDSFVQSVACLMSSTGLVPVECTDLYTPFNMKRSIPEYKAPV